MRPALVTINLVVWFMRTIRNTRNFLLSLLLAFFIWPVPAQAEAPWTSAGPDGAPIIEFYFFWSAKCPHCLDAHPHVTALTKRMPWLKIHDLELSQYSESIRTHLFMANLLRQEISSVPAFMFCGEVHLGRVSAETTGAFLIERLT